MKTVVVTGAEGQLAKCIKKIADKYSEQLRFVFLTKADLDITSTEQLERVFSSTKMDYCVNCAAYTNVEKAEEEKEKAFLVNAQAAKQLAETCKTHRVTLIHFSTDYVFNGEAKLPYHEDHSTQPLNVYGASKLEGEQHIQQALEQYFIFRISWLYSEFGHNFYKTILQKAKQGDRLSLTTEQTGSPTNANDVAQMICRLMASGNTDYGLYHYTNAGETTWYGFAQEIIKNAGLPESLLTSVAHYPTKAKRPEYSVLGLTKVKRNLQITLVLWQKSLQRLMNRGEMDERE